MTVSIADDEQNLTVDVEADAPPDSLTEVEDRIGALGGTLTIDRALRRSSAHAELPCG